MDLKIFIPLGIIPMSIIPMSKKITSPFAFGSTVSTNAFANREAEAGKLSSNLMSGINTIIISPRRWGKSSLVEKVTADIQASGSEYRIVSIDLFAISSKEEFLELFAQEVIKASSGKWEEWVKQAKEVFKNIIPKIELSADPNSSLSLRFDWEELEKHQNEIIDLPELLAKKKKVKFIVCIDEFQNLAGLAGFEALEKKLRALWQRHKNVTYCLYGSKRHMMTEIFNRSSKPFYRFGDIMMLPRIKRQKWVPFIQERFKSTGKNISEKLSEKLADLMQDHSWYVQQLAHYTWNISGKTATEENLKRALRELIDANSPLFQREIEILSGTQTNLIKALLKNETKLTSEKVMRTYALGTPRNVSKNRDLLIRNDVIQTTETGFEFLDPTFRLWLLEKMMKIPVDRHF